MRRRRHLQTFIHQLPRPLNPDRIETSSRSTQRRRRTPAVQDKAPGSRKPARSGAALQRSLSHCEVVCRVQLQAVNQRIDLGSRMHQLRDRLFRLLVVLESSRARCSPAWQTNPPASAHPFPCWSYESCSASTHWRSSAGKAVHHPSNSASSRCRSLSLNRPWAAAGLPTPPPQPTE